MSNENTSKGYLVLLFFALIIAICSMVVYICFKPENWLIPSIIGILLIIPLRPLHKLIAKKHYQGLHLQL